MDEFEVTEFTSLEKLEELLIRLLVDAGEDGIRGKVVFRDAAREAELLRPHWSKESVGAQLSNAKSNAALTLNARGLSLVTRKGGMWAITTDPAEAKRHSDKLAARTIRHTRRTFSSIHAQALQFGWPPDQYKHVEALMAAAESSIEQMMKVQPEIEPRRRRRAQPVGQESLL